MLFCLLVFLLSHNLLSSIGEEGLKMFLTDERVQGVTLSVYSRNIDDCDKKQWDVLCSDRSMNKSLIREQKLPNAFVSFCFPLRQIIMT